MIVIGPDPIDCAPARVSRTDPHPPSLVWLISDHHLLVSDTAQVSDDIRKLVKELASLPVRLSRYTAARLVLSSHSIRAYGQMCCRIYMYEVCCSMSA